MAERLLLVTHDTEDKDDRASRWAADQGFELIWTCPAEGGGLPELDSVAGLIVYGGRYDIREQDKHVFLKDEMRYIESALGRDKPVLGLCLGGQLLAHVLGEDVGPHPEGWVEYGYYDLTPTRDGAALFGSGLKVLQSHWHGWFATPAGAVPLAGTTAFPQQAFRYGGNAFAFQFHPEASRKMLERWIGRRPPERHAMPGAFPPDRQLADNLRYDRQLGDWFLGFLDVWMNTERRREAAE